MSARHPSAGGVCLRVRACVRACACVHVRACVHVCGCVCPCACARACMSACASPHAYAACILRCVRARMDACGCARTDVPRDDRAFAPSACSSGTTTGGPRHAPPTERMRPGLACVAATIRASAMRVAPQRALLQRSERARCASRRSVRPHASRRTVSRTDFYPTRQVAAPSSEPWSSQYVRLCASASAFHALSVSTSAS